MRRRLGIGITAVCTEKADALYMSGLRQCGSRGGRLEVSLATLFIKRPVATTLLTLGVVLAGFFAYLKLPVAPLPQIDFPTITVFAAMPGASPDVMAASVATPLERHLGVIADVS